MIKRVINSQKFQQARWFVLPALVGIAVVMGAQSASDKVGVVDRNQVMQQSDFGKRMNMEFEQTLKKRQTLVDFVGTYRVASESQAEELKSLWLKDKPAEADVTKLESLKQEIMSAYKKRNELSQKKDLSSDDSALLKELSQKAQGVLQVLDRWQMEFREELMQLQEKARIESFEKANAAIKETAKKEGYSQVFDASIMPYCANDLTEAAIKTANAKK